MAPQDFHAHSVPLFDRGVGRKAAAEIAHVFNIGSVLDRTPLAVDCRDLHGKVDVNPLCLSSFNQI
jgi:hypothetical protein